MWTHAFRLQFDLEHAGLGGNCYRRPALISHDSTMGSGRLLPCLSCASDPTDIFKPDLLTHAPWERSCLSDSGAPQPGASPATGRIAAPALRLGMSATACARSHTVPSSGSRAPGTAARQRRRARWCLTARPPPRPRACPPSRRPHPPSDLYQARESQRSDLGPPHPAVARRRPGQRFPQGQVRHQRRPGPASPPQSCAGTAHECTCRSLTQTPGAPQCQRAHSAPARLQSTRPRTAASHCRQRSLRGQVHCRNRLGCVDCPNPRCRAPALLPLAAAGSRCRRRAQVRHPKHPSCAGHPNPPLGHHGWRRYLQARPLPCNAAAGKRCRKPGPVHHPRRPRCAGHLPPPPERRRCPRCMPASLLLRSAAAEKRRRQRFQPGPVHRPRHPGCGGSTAVSLRAALLPPLPAAAPAPAARRRRRALPPAPAAGTGRPA